MRIDWNDRRETLTVSELTLRIRNLLAGSFADMWVAGEISGLKIATSGHAYFTLKDSGAQVRAACFRNTLRLLKFRPQEGMAVLVRGRIDVYEPRGEYQLLVDWLEPQGAGALQAAFEQLKKRLEAEGLFDAARKRPLPRFPRRIGIVTSRSGAVIRDMLHVLARRNPGIHVRLYPAQVQGEGSVAAVVEAIEYFSDSGWPDLLIVGRGGGSLEDLWTFNEESVARAIASCPVPVISAVGHETDFTIADFVADLRAPTPSAAAELAVPNQMEILAAIDNAGRHIERAMGLLIARKSARLGLLGVDRAEAMLARRLGRAAQRLDDLDARAGRRLRATTQALLRRVEDAVAGLRRSSPQARMAMAERRWRELTERLGKTDPRVRSAELRRRIEERGTRAERLTMERIARLRLRLERNQASLAALSPVRILERGYSIVLTGEGRVLRDVRETAVGKKLRIRLSRGELEARVDRTALEADGTGG
ncbi:MAG: exodeoxyribonuclease VII large subunit [Bryobacteraceae bacterium]